MSILRHLRSFRFAFLCLWACAPSAFANSAKPAPSPSGQPRLPFLRRYAQPTNRGPAATPPPQAKLPFLRRYAQPRNDIKITRDSPGAVRPNTLRAPASQHVARPPRYANPPRYAKPQSRGRPLATYSAYEPNPTPQRQPTRAPAAAAPPTAYSASPSGPTNIKMTPLHPQLRNETDTERTIRLDMTRRYLPR